jgi:outer membrane protein
MAFIIKTSVKDSSLRWVKPFRLELGPRLLRVVCKQQIDGWVGFKYRKKGLNMKRTSLTIAALAKVVSVAVLCALPIGFACAEAKIAVVSLEAVIQESPQLKVMQQTLQVEFGARERELTQQQKDLKAKADKYQKDSATMTEADKARLERELREGQREFERRGAEYKEDVNTRQNEEIQKLQRAIAQDVQSYAKFQGYDLVLYQGVLYAKENFDITQQVIQAIRDKAPKPAADKAPPAATGTQKK